MTIRSNVLKRGYFPKELPPAFSTADFARYACTKAGREVIEAYKPQNNYTECVSYFLARPRGDRRELKVPHPAAFTCLTDLVAKNIDRLLKKGQKSPFSASSPTSSASSRRAFSTKYKAKNRDIERNSRRAGAQFALQADVSDFYQSLYTHSVGWAIDPSLRQRVNWNNGKLLGKQLDRALMNADGKISQGIPTGTDLSFLLAECVLSQVDHALNVSAERAFRWYDDYEFVFDTREDAERCLKQLREELARFRLRLNSTKTKIIMLPKPEKEDWQARLRDTGEHAMLSAQKTLRHFDEAFRLREQIPDEPILQYAVGRLFQSSRPISGAWRVIQSCLTQALLTELGAAQKIFALMSYWMLHGYSPDLTVLRSTICRLVINHKAGGVSSDVAWALSFCLEHKIALDKASAKVLSTIDDDVIALQSLDMNSRGLLPSGFSSATLNKTLKKMSLDGEHWLLGYEAVFQGFLGVSRASVLNNTLFSELLKRGISFYRRNLPQYASIIHQGSAPEWLVDQWILSIIDPQRKKPKGVKLPEIPAELKKDLMLGELPLSIASAMERLRGMGTEDEELVVADDLADIYN